MKSAMAKVASIIDKVKYIASNLKISIMAYDSISNRQPKTKAATMKSVSKAISSVKKSASFGGGWYRSGEGVMPEMRNEISEKQYRKAWRSLAKKKKSSGEKLKMEAYRSAAKASISPAKRGGV
jgi:hypothetical protein